MLPIASRSPGFFSFCWHSSSPSPERFFFNNVCWEMFPLLLMGFWISFSLCFWAFFPSLGFSPWVFLLHCLWWWPSFLLRVHFMFSQGGGLCLLFSFSGLRWFLFWVFVYPVPLPSPLGFFALGLGFYRAPSVFIRSFCLSFWALRGRVGRRGVTPILT